MEFQTKSTSKEIYQYCFKRRERKIKKNAKEIIANVSKEEGFTVVVEDYSIYKHYAVVRRRMWVDLATFNRCYYRFTSENLCVWSSMHRCKKAILQTIQCL